ncbi:MAG: hypothetical protein B6241_06745 [Spirochaetaceae bacterium 4572_59]|nr:MAG: hypothetical protein B6241_06745 [Spirochaetaceae bacterium 4572_59]
MNEHSLYAWIGNTDIRCFEEDNRENPGPVAQAYRTGRYDRLILLFNHITLSREGYDRWLQTLPLENNIQKTITIEIIDRPMENPTDFSAIYEIVTEQLSKRNSENRTYHLSPGTPAMAAVWMLVSAGPYPAELIESSLQMGVKDVHIPFDISFRYRPEITAFTQSVIGLTSGLPEDSVEFKMILTKSGQMKKLKENAKKAAVFNVPVLLLGESGTGKEMVANAVHSVSARKNGPLVSVNCGAIPRELLESELFGYEKGAFTGAEKNHKGFLEQADKGSLFLDEVAELSLQAQVKLLRVLQTGYIRPVGSEKDIKVDFRVIAATNKDLMQEVVEGRFREDLFHRLAVAVLKLIPLREREGDIAFLSEKLSQKVNKTFSDEAEGNWRERSLSEEALQVLIEHDWPGNIRELQNSITRLFLWADKPVISKEEARFALHRKTESSKEKQPGYHPLGDGIDLNAERDRMSFYYIQEALKQSGGVKKRAAELLGFKNYQTLSMQMEKLGIVWK